MASAKPDMHNVAYAQPVNSPPLGQAYAQAIPVGGQQQQHAYPIQQGIPVGQAYVNTQTVYQPVIVNSQLMGRNPCELTCPYCAAHVITRVERTPGAQAHLWAFGLCIFGCWPCCLIPYCMEDCMLVVHSCPNCNRVIGTSGF